MFQRLRPSGIGRIWLAGIAAGLLLAPTGAAQGAAARGAAGKPRVVISSDFPPIDVIPGGLNQGPPEKRSDPDDVQSMVRFLTYANEFRVEGLIATAATLANTVDKRHILDVLDRYEQVEANLRLHDKAFPTAAALRKVTTQGLAGTYGKPAAQILGEGKDSEASEFIIRLIDQPDPAPVWFCFWGGSRELAQALWKVRRSRSPAELSQFVAKIRAYFIAQQDGTTQWLLDEFPGLFAILSERAYPGMSYRAPGSVPETGNLAWLNANVREGHGPLGALYPRSAWDARFEGVYEGDSPSFLYLLSGSTGLSDTGEPSWGGWGGRFMRVPEAGRLWLDATEGQHSISLWHEARQRDFAARMDWCVKPYSAANHAPLAVLNGDRGVGALRFTARPGGTISLNAAGSGDPDRHALAFRWWQYREPGTCSGEVAISGAAAAAASVAIPTDAANCTFHIILEVTDNGAPALTSYRRAVIQVAGR